MSRRGDYSCFLSPGLGCFDSGVWGAIAKLHYDNTISLLRCIYRNRKICDNTSYYRTSSSKKVHRIM